MAARRWNTHGGTRAEHGEVYWVMLRFSGHREERSCPAHPFWEMRPENMSEKSRHSNETRTSGLLTLAADFRLLRYFGGLRCERLIHFQIGHLQFTEQIEQQIFFFGRQVSLGFFLEHVKHVDHFTRRFGIDHRLAAARGWVGGQDHGGARP